MLTNKIKVLDFSRELPMACLSRNENIEGKNLIPCLQRSLTQERTGRTGADVIGVCKNGKLITRRSSFLT